MTPTPTLIVDDSSMIVKIIKKALLANSIDGFYFEEQSIYTASDGMEAFEIMGERHDIKLIISDINMPHLNGDEFIEILNDTGKLESLDVVFVTSTPNLKLYSSIKESILGIIYKPFQANKFNEQLNLLFIKKQKQTTKHNKIKEIQLKQKKYIEKICIKYIKNFGLPIKIDILNSFIDEMFGDESIPKDQFAEIAYAVLSNFVYELNQKHTVNTKNILCIINSFDEKSKIVENRFDLIGGFKSQIEYVNSTELTLNNILKELTVPLFDKISMAFSKVKQYPKYKSLLLAKYYPYITDEFEKIDCLFMNDELKKTLLEYDEIFVFSQWLNDFIGKNRLYESVKAVVKSKALRDEVIKNLRKIDHNSNLLAQHYCGKIEFLIWQRAKNSVEISKYLKSNMPNTLLNSARYLFHKKKINIDELDLFLALEKENIIVVSSDLNLLEVFKNITKPPFNQWNFYCFSNLDLIDTWMNKNTPNKIIIDYNFKSATFKNGIGFLELIIKKYPIYKNILYLRKVYVIANNNQLVDIREYKRKYKFSVIDDSLKEKELHHSLIY